MGILYKEPKDIIYKATIEILQNGNLRILFTCDGGKFGTDEMIDEYELSVLELLHALQYNTI